MALRIVTDSTADLSSDLMREYGIEMVPLSVLFGEESYKDAVEMGVDQFWEKLGTSPHHPRTAQPSPGDFLKVYQPLHEAGDEIISLHISGRLSGTVGSAQIAAGMLPGARITVIDTRTTTLGLGMMVLEAARMARAGKTAAEVTAAINALIDRTILFCTVDTLEFLQKNGRIGKAAALLGGLLGVKPILKVDSEGVVSPADKVRGKSKVLPRVLELMQEHVPAGRRIKLGVLHAQAAEDAQIWADEVRAIYQVEECLTASIGPVLATHVGPGALGVVFHEV